MHIRFHYKIESQLKFANILELSLEQVPHEPQDGASHISLNFSPTRAIALLGQISGQEVGILSIDVPLLDSGEIIHFLLSAPLTFCKYLLLCFSYCNLVS